jgi:glyoxylase-like metal-dependent hydrolase (beta-lactamase superfamily II)
LALLLHAVRFAATIVCDATAGDAVAWVPHSRTLYAGDLLFIGGTPIVWAGPYKNWVTACERMVSQSD